MQRRAFLRSTAWASLATAAHLLPMNTLNGFGRWAENGPKSPKMPVLFLGHGSPMNAIEDNAFTRGWKEVASRLPHPRAILCVSAHWYIRGTKVTAMERPRTIHDFGGFPQALFDVQYPAPGSPELAAETTRLLDLDGAAQDDHWGLDHGAWSVILHLFPDADVPVVQLSLDAGLSPEGHMDLARRLAPLRERGILIVGSGNIVHNLRMVDFAGLAREDYGYDWAREARATVNAHLLNGRLDALADYGKAGQALRMAVPTPDHYLPLVYAAALQGKGEDLVLFNDHLVGGSISMTSVAIGL